MDRTEAGAFSAQEAKRHQRNFCIVQFLMGLFIASTLYASAYLKELGLTPGQVGLFTSIRSIVGVFIPIVWGMACDKFHTVKKVFFVCLMGVVILFPIVPLFEHVPFGALTMAPVMTVIVRFFYRPLDYMFSSWMVQMEKRVPNIEYGKVRIYASVATAIASMGFTYLIAKFSTVRVGYYGGGVLALLVVFAMQKLPDVTSGTGKHASFKDLKLGRLARDPLLVAMLLVMTCANIPSSSTSVYIPYLLDEIGAHMSTLGAFNTVRSLCGIPLMYLSGRIVRRYGARRVLTFSIIVMGLGEFAFSQATSAAYVLGIGLLIGFNTGLLTVSQVLYAQELAPPELRSTVQMLNSTTLALATMIASTLGGNIVGTAGVRTYYQVTCVIVLVAVTLFMLANRYFVRRRQNALATE